VGGRIHRIKPLRGAEVPTSEASCRLDYSPSVTVTTAATCLAFHPGRGVSSVPRPTRGLRSFLAACDAHQDRRCTRRAFRAACTRSRRSRSLRGVHQLSAHPSYNRSDRRPQRRGFARTLPRGADVTARTMTSECGESPLSARHCESISIAADEVSRHGALSLRSLAVMRARSGEQGYAPNRGSRYLRVHRCFPHIVDSLKKVSGSLRGAISLNALAYVAPRPAQPGPKR